eukprot:1240222-Rhodomonas_salina.1
MMLLRCRYGKSRAGIDVSSVRNQDPMLLRPPYGMSGTDMSDATVTIRISQRRLGPSRAAHPLPPPPLTSSPA